MKLFLNYKIDHENKQNFKNLLEKSFYYDSKMNQELKLQHVLYKTLKEYFIYFNYESFPKTFTEKIYSKYNLDNLKIISEQDLKIAFTDTYDVKIKEILNSRNKGKGNNLFFKFIDRLNFDIPTHKDISYNSKINNNKIEWNIFYSVLEEFIMKYNIKKTDLDDNLKDFSILLEKKDLDFEYYQSLFKKTKRNIFYSTMRDLLYSTRETNSNVLE